MGQHTAQTEMTYKCMWSVWASGQYTGWRVSDVRGEGQCTSITTVHMYSTCTCCMSVAYSGRRGHAYAQQQTMSSWILTITS